MSFVTNENLKRYRTMSEDDLKREITRNNLEIAKAYSLFGRAKVKGSSSKGDLTGGVIKRIRKENARIHTIINERRLGIHR